MPRNPLALTSGLVLAATSLYFSTSGLVRLFPESSAMLVVLAGGFEMAKISITVYLIRNFRWHVLGVLLAGGLAILSGVSSLGIYGTLGRSYNAGRAVTTSTEAQSAALSTRLTGLQQDRAALMAQVEMIPKGQGTNRRRVMAQIAPQVQQIDAGIRQTRDSLTLVLQQKAVAEQDIGDLKYAAALFGVTQDALAQFIITSLAFLLDPLALMLLFASGYKGRRETTAAPQPVQEPDLTPDFTPRLVRTPVPFTVHTAQGASQPVETESAVEPVTPPRPRIMLQSSSDTGLSPGLTAALSHLQSTAPPHSPEKVYGSAGVSPTAAGQVGDSS